MTAHRREISAVTTCMVMVGVALATTARRAEAEVAIVTHGPPDRTTPAATFDGRPGAYGIGTVYQLSADTAALFLNVRLIGERSGDFEDGTDAIPFRRLEEAGTVDPVVLSRNELDAPGDDGQRLVVKFPVIGGFVPRGARRADGSPFPGAGHGFGIAQALSFPYAGGGLVTWKGNFVRYLEVHDLTYDGESLHTEAQLIRQDDLLKTADGRWSITVPGLMPAIPDGDDLLFACSARGPDGGFTGVSRWRFENGRWRPVSFEPVGRGSEPSLVRDATGRLVFSRRGPNRSDALELWCRTDTDSWRRSLAIPRKRTPSPVSVCAAADGSVFLCANVAGTNRDSLMAWLLNASLDGIAGERLVRDCTAEFGMAPDNTYWACDHPTGATIRLADGRWHNLLLYRLLAFPRGGRAEPIVPQTGCCVEDIVHTQTIIPAWTF